MDLARYAMPFFLCARDNSAIVPVQSSHGVMLHVVALSPISNLNRSSFHSVYMLAVAFMASLWPGPTLAGRASAMSRHMPGPKNVNVWNFCRWRDGGIKYM